MTAMHIGFTYQSCLYTNRPYLKAVVDSWFIGQQRTYQLNLDSFLNCYGQYSVEKILNKLFPTPDTNIFISHSHDDFEEAKYLAYKLTVDFHQKVFLDEYVWGSADALLKQINDNQRAAKENKNYEYKDICLNASSIYILLANAISKVIHKCDTFIFMESLNSVNVLTLGCTDSPWIYFELQLINEIIENENKLKRESGLLKLAAEEMIPPVIAFPANYKSFNKFSIYDLKELVAEEIQAGEANYSDGLMQRLNQYLISKNDNH